MLLVWYCLKEQACDNQFSTILFLYFFDLAYAELEIYYLLKLLKKFSKVLNFLG